MRRVAVNAGPCRTFGGLIAGLWWVMLAVAAALALFVLALLAFAWWRSDGQAATERVWTLGLGLGLTLPVLAALVGYGFWVGERILPRDDGALRVTVTAQHGPDGDRSEGRQRDHIEHVALCIEVLFGRDPPSHDAIRECVDDKRRTA